MIPLIGTRSCTIYTLLPCLYYSAVPWCSNIQINLVFNKKTVGFHQPIHGFHQETPEYFIAQPGRKYFVLPPHTVRVPVQLEDFLRDVFQHILDRQQVVCRILV